MLTTVPKLKPKNRSRLVLLGSVHVARLFVVVVLPAVAAAQSPPSSPNRPEPGNQVRDYAPGLRIDWSNRRIELDAKVVLRKGPLELFACSPQSREHESIFVVPARPLRIYEALGLIGLEPGHPVRFDKASEAWLPPTGAALRVSVQCGRDNVDPIPAERLLRSTDGDKPLSGTSWVFAGSVRYDGDRFGADMDGTVICVVDFETALITVNALHTSDNEQLWLEANTEAIPPVGTECTILIGARERPRFPLELRLLADGTLRLGKATVSLTDLAVELKNAPEGPTGLAIHMTTESGVDRTRLDDLVRELVELGVRRDAIRMESDSAD